MRTALVTLLIATATMGFAQTPSHSKKPEPSVPAGDDYRTGPDSQRQPGVPTGKTFEFTFAGSKVLPGTSRKVTVYVPAQYKGDKPACVYVGLDNLGFAATVVFDNLIHKNEMPVTIGIGVSPGQVDSADPPSNPRLNRSFEFDGLNDSLARFLLEELLPEVERHRTPDGLPILLSKDPNDRCTGGGSTGGIAAFTLAWERPDAFRRVFTAIGTFVGMRGGDRYPVLVRKTEPKPIRVFMQDGSNDQWLGGPEVGDWWMGNQTLERALSFAGYQVEHVWGEGIHSGRHATAVFPDAMRWLWKDWPQPVRAGQTQNTVLKAILPPEDRWQTVASGYKRADALASNAKGEVFFRDAGNQKTYRIARDERIGESLSLGNKGRGMAFGPDGRLYAVDPEAATITACGANGQTSTIATGIRGHHLLVTHQGNLYVTEPGVGTADPSNVWLVRPDGEKTLVDSGLDAASGIALSPDGLWLCVVERRTHWGYSYQVQPDGTLQHKQRFYWFHVPDWADDSGAGSLAMDRDGRLYAATRMGVQVLDRNGRVRAILPVPGGEVTSVAFGGENFDTLYATSAGVVYKRKLKVSGMPPWAAPIQLPPWGAG
jgi:enterochelin esterase-like enzyme